MIGDIIIIIIITYVKKVRKSLVFFNRLYSECDNSYCLMFVLNTSILTKKIFFILYFIKISSN